VKAYQIGRAGRLFNFAWNNAHLLEWPGIADGKGMMVEEAYEDLDWCRAVVGAGEAQT